MSDTAAFSEAFVHFKKLILEASGHEFTNFNEGRAAVWESYKPILREHALSVLDVDGWDENTIGQGTILDKAIQAIELQSSNSNHTNNLVFWQNRYGHASRAHKSFIDAKDDKRLCQRIENALYDLFKRDNDERAFRALNEISEGKYPLIAYLFFLKDMHQYVPILPTVYDKAFQALNINLVTLRNCSWENYVSYNQALGDVAQFLKGVVDQDGLNLIDAHSFCYLLIKTEDELEDGKLVSGKKDDGVILGEQDRRIWEIKDTVKKTVSSSNGQVEERAVKAKDLNMSDEQLMAEIKRLMNRQEHRCALTGLKLDYADKPVDVQMRPSLDRIDSDGHYELGNLQVVCRFINFWKSNQNNDEFLRLLQVLRAS